MSGPTPLADAYAARQRGTVELLDWRYPREFSDPVVEHRAVRSDAGLFDLSFMAHFVARGPDALAFVQWVITNDAARLEVGAALYSPICGNDGTFVDDCTVIRRGPDDYLISTGLHSTFGWLLAQQTLFGATLEDHSRRLSVIAAQGPASPRVLEAVGLGAAVELEYFRAMELSLRGIPALVARIGYTGELGYEVFVAADGGVDAWHLLEEAGRAAGLVPCGALALNSLRIEAGYLMTRVDFDETTTPYEAGLGRLVKLTKRQFVGRRALSAARVPARYLVGLRTADAAVPAWHAAVRDPTGRSIGYVTSACASPTLGGVIVLAYVDRTVAESAVVGVDEVAAPWTLSPLPFYDPSRSRVRACPAPTTGC